MDEITANCRSAVRWVRVYTEERDRFSLEVALTALERAFSECNRLGRHDPRARVCRMRNWVSAELARTKR